MVSAASLLIALGACTSFEEVKQQADMGNAEMQFKASQMLLEGEGIEPDKQAAEKYLELALKSGHLLAACHVIKSIHNNPRGDQSKLLMEAYDVLFSKKPKGWGEFSHVFRLQKDYPDDVITYIKYLNRAGYGKAAFEFKKYSFSHLDRDKCHRRGRDINKYSRRINLITTTFEVIERKRIAKEKRIAEEKRIA